ncbi:MAG: hypothetical protein HC884_04530 [Chloroflexaceae bacterium]|nr:hypothetical protein [Chloroflexaceae bacterium]
MRRWKSEHTALPDAETALPVAKIAVPQQAGVVTGLPLVILDTTARPDLAPLLTGMIQVATVEWQWAAQFVAGRLVVLLQVIPAVIPSFTIGFHLDTPDQAQRLFLLAMVGMMRLVCLRYPDQLMEFDCAADEPILRLISNVPGEAARHLLVRDGATGEVFDLEAMRVQVRERQRVAKTA